MITKTSEKKPVALNDWTYHYLKEKILNLEIEPGEQIHIEVFIEKLEVSRTPIREAFLRLANESLIEIKPRVGYFVTEITGQDIKDLFEARVMFETRAAKNAAELLSDEDLEKLKILMAESSKAVEKGNLSKYLEIEIEFHGYFQKHVYNKRILAFMESLDDLTYRERVLSLQSEENVEMTLVEHQRIVDALVKRDAKMAEWLMGEHLHNVSERLVKHLDENKINK